MSRIALARQLEAVTLAHLEARATLRQQLQARTIDAASAELRQQHVLRLRAARETLLTLLRDQAPGLSRLQHDAMVAGDAMPAEEMESPE